jgi:uncharacterized Zn finger protein
MSSPPRPPDCDPRYGNLHELTVVKVSGPVEDPSYVYKCTTCGAVGEDRFKMDQSKIPRRTVA